MNAILVLLHFKIIVDVHLDPIIILDNTENKRYKTVNCTENLTIYTIFKYKSLDIRELFDACKQKGDTVAKLECLNFVFNDEFFYQIDFLELNFTSVTVQLL